MNNKLGNIRESGTLTLNDRIGSLIQSGREIIKLNVGEPDFATPPEIIESAYRSMKNGVTNYCDSRGLPEFRSAVADKIKRERKIEYCPDTELIASVGAVHACYIGLSAILNPGDEALIPDPAWPAYTNIVKILGGKVVRVPGELSNDFFPTVSEFQKYCSEKTRAVIINSPMNPTGSVAKKEYLTEILRFAQKNDIFIISDEVYEKLVFDGKHTSIVEIEGAKERSLLINSFSKTYAMTGWRVGCLAAPKPVIDRALKASQSSITSVPPFIQTAAITALVDPAVKKFITAKIQEYSLRRKIAGDILEGAARTISYQQPEGAFYYWIDISKTGKTSQDAANELLDKWNTALVPGSVFGRNGEGFLRLSLSADTDDVKKGAENFVKWVIEKIG